MAEAARKQRWDAGTVRVSRRDLSVLRVVGENGGARLSLLRRLLALHGDETERGYMAWAPNEDPMLLSDSATRHWVGRMVAAGYLRQARVLGGSWVTVTPAGARLVGLVDGAGHATPRVIESAILAEHTNTVGLLRLWLAAEHPAARWVPERDFWLEQQSAKVGFRRPDGALDFGGRRVGIEVELHRKRPDKYVVILGATHRSLAEVWWYAPGDLTGWLAERLDHARGQLLDGPAPLGPRKVTPCLVHELPREVWP